MRSPSRVRAPEGKRERGSVTAEFAVVVPAVMLVLAASLASLQVAGEQLRLQDAVADASRSIARGDGAAVAGARLRSVVAGATLELGTRGDLVCVTAHARSVTALAGIVRFELEASGCALDGGR